MKNENIFKTGATYRLFTRRVLYTTMLTAKYSPLTRGSHVLSKIFPCHCLRAVLVGAFNDFFRATFFVLLFKKYIEIAIICHKENIQNTCKGTLLKPGSHMIVPIVSVASVASKSLLAPITFRLCKRQKRQRRSGRSYENQPLSPFIPFQKMSKHFLKSTKNAVLHVNW